MTLGARGINASRGPTAPGAPNPSGAPDPQGPFECFVRGIPAPKGSKMARYSEKSGVAFVVDNNPKSLRSWEAAVRFVLQQRWQGGVYPDAVAVRLDFFFLRPKSVSAKKRPDHTVTPDLDKIARACLDPMTGIVFRDDAQVTNLTLSKSYAEESGVRIVIEAIRAG